MKQNLTIPVILCSCIFWMEMVKANPGDTFTYEEAVASQGTVNHGVTGVNDPRILAQKNAFEALSRQVTIENLNRARATGIPETDIQAFLIRSAETRAREAEKAFRARLARSARLAQIAREAELEADRLCGDEGVHYQKKTSPRRISSDNEPLYVESNYRRRSSSSSYLDDSSTPSPVLPISSDRISSGTVHGRVYSVDDKDGRNHTGVIYGDKTFSVTVPFDAGDKPIMQGCGNIIPLD